MRLRYLDDVVMLRTVGNDRYGQPVLSPPKAAKVKWQQKQDTVSVMAPFPIPTGIVFWFGKVDDFNIAMKNNDSKGINLWVVKFPSFQKDIIGRIAYYTAELQMQTRTNLGTLP